MAYDENVFRATREQLLVNIQRARLNRPLHFTRVPSVAAMVPEAEEQRLAYALETWRPNEILVDIRPGYPGGDFPGPARFASAASRPRWCSSRRTWVE